MEVEGSEIKTEERVTNIATFAVNSIDAVVDKEVIDRSNSLDQVLKSNGELSDLTIIHIHVSESCILCIKNILIFEVQKSSYSSACRTPSKYTLSTQVSTNMWYKIS